MTDLIERQAAIDAVLELIEARRRWVFDASGEIRGLDAAMCEIDNLPSAEPEIVRCKDCKYRDENWRRVSVRWLPCMDVRTGSNWYCGSAERRTDD